MMNTNEKSYLTEDFGISSIIDNINQTNFKNIIAQILMKTPRIIVCFIVGFLCFNSIIAQNTSLSILTTGVYGINTEKGIESVIDTNNHKTLLAAYQATDLNTLLDDNGPFTIFAPSDNAFASFSKSKLHAMLNADDKKQLKSVLKYHIVSGKLTASKILKALCRGKGKTTFTTIHGDKITATMRGLDIFLTDSNGNTARITAADSIKGDNVMHAIDSVILPARL